MGCGLLQRCAPVQHAYGSGRGGRCALGGGGWTPQRQQPRRPQSRHAEGTCGRIDGMSGRGARTVKSANEGGGLGDPLLRGIVERQKEGGLKVLPFAHQTEAVSQARLHRGGLGEVPGTSSVTICRPPSLPQP